MSTLYSGEDIEAQGGTQFVSEMKYFLAMDEFYFSNKKSCNTNSNSDKNEFIKYVGNLVLLSDPNIPNRFYTKNFSKSFGKENDFDIGSNFFSVNAVKNSKTSKEPIDFPSRHPRLLICDKGEISIASEAYENFSLKPPYFGGSLKQKATILLFWLNRNTEFQSNDSMYDDFISHMKQHHTEKLLQSLTLESTEVKQTFESIKSKLSSDNNIHYLTPDDFSTEQTIPIENFKSTKFVSPPNKQFPSPDLFASDSTHKPSQIIYYGVPGCGKSNQIDETLKDVPESNKIRTVFHPEYTNADFVGQILPQQKTLPDGKTTIAYEFTPGPFTEILQRAIQKPEEPFYLIIEEINRGNAAAIFGEVFQLLDRTDSGESRYPVRKKEVCDYLKKDEIRLPANLSIIATMNSSDQNVFTLDNAFQRRFDMVLVRSGVTRKTTGKVPSLNKDDYNFDNDDIKAQFQATIEIANTPWGPFWDWINYRIMDKLQGISNTEDKRLGLWFVKNAAGTIPKKIFAEKVLKYLWDDVFKFKRKEIFSESIHSLEELISAFEDSTDTNVLSRIFKDYPQNDAE